jgi:hypothetical protein
MQKSNWLEKEETKLLIAFLILFPVLFIIFQKPLNDFWHHIYTTRAWLAGETKLYDSEYFGFVYSPWLVLLYIPFALLPDYVAKGLFTIISMWILIWSIWMHVKASPWWVTALAVTNIYTVIHLIQGQVDILVLGFLSLAWLAIQQKKPYLFGLALVGATTKITNVALPLLIMLLSLRKWPREDLGKASLIPLFTLLISPLIAGLDWPLRYWRVLQIFSQHLTEYEVITAFGGNVYQVSLWSQLNQLGKFSLIILTAIVFYLIYRMLREGIDFLTIGMALALNLVLSPYTVLHHYIYLEPATGKILAEYRTYGLLIFSVTVLDLILSWFEINYPFYGIAVLSILIFIKIKELHVSPVRTDAMLG